MPSAKPRSSSPNHAITARPLAAFTPAPTAPVTDSAATSDAKLAALPAHTRPAAAPVCPIAEQDPELAACATTPAERMVQRYLRAGAGVEVTKLPELVGVRALAVLAGDLEHDREMLHVGMGEEDSESVADQAVADVVVTVAVGAEW